MDQLANPFINALLVAIKLTGSRWVPVGVEGPRRVGHCVYCAGPCHGVTNMCEVRVWQEKGQ